MSVDINGLAFKLAYNGVNLAFDGLDPHGENAGAGNLAEMNSGERSAICNGILSLLEILEEDVDGDGVVDMNDAEAILEAAIDKYTVDVNKKEEFAGEMYPSHLVNTLSFHWSLNDKGVDNSVKDFIWSFYMDISGAQESAGEHLEKESLELWRKTLYGE